MEDFLEIYRAFYGKVFTFVLSLVRSKANAQDITQNIFMKLWKNRKKLEHIKSMDDYLFILSKNTCMDYFRKASRKKGNLHGRVRRVPSLQNSLLTGKTN